MIKTTTSSQPSQTHISSPVPHILSRWNQTISFLSDPPHRTLPIVHENDVMSQLETDRNHNIIDPISTLTKQKDNADSSLVFNGEGDP